jgi:hypothetical protein
MKTSSERFGNEQGSVLLLALLIITLLVLIGVWSTNTSTTETTIAGNQKLSKIAFYNADGGAELGVALVEANIDSRGDGFAVGTLYGTGAATDHNKVTIATQKFYLNSDMTSKPDCTNRDAYTPTDGSCSGRPAITNLRIGGNSELSTGGAIQMIAGYEGKGKGSAGAGSWVTYDIRAQHRNVRNSEAIINLRWRHVL